MENNIDEIKKSGVINTFHKDDCVTYFRNNCNCSEEEGTIIHKKYFQIQYK